MEINIHHLKAVIKLTPQKRFEYFIKKIVDTEKVWGLYNEGWALSSTDDGLLVFPLWPAKEFADLCIINEWKLYKAKSFDLNELIFDLLPKLKNDKILVGVFYTFNDKGITPNIENFIQALNIEKNKY